MVMLWGYFEGQPITVVSGSIQKAFPKYLFSGKPHKIISSNRDVVYYPNFIEACRIRQVKTVAIIRTYALGDILMLLPISRVLRREIGLESRIRIVIREDLWYMLREWSAAQEDFEFLRDAGDMTYDYGDIHINLDSCLEKDHWGRVESEYHRCELYGQALGMEVTHGEL